MKADELTTKISRIENQIANLTKYLPYAELIREKAV